MDDDGTAYLSYWRLPLAGEESNGAGIGIARSCDNHYEKWEKMKTPSLDCTELGILEQKDGTGAPMYLGNSDPSNIWKKDGIHYMEAGNLPVLNKLGRDDDSPVHYRGDWVDLFSSADLIDWKFVHRFYSRDEKNNWTGESEDDRSCGHG